MSTISRLVLTSALAVGMVQSAAAASFDNVVIFGDSLSDAGHYGARFTTNPGLTALEYVALHYGFVVQPSLPPGTVAAIGIAGGTDYAYGGARVMYNPGVPNSPPTDNAVPVAEQITGFLATGPLNPNALYAVWAGANDVFYQTGLVGASIITPAQMQTNLAQAVTDELTQIARLQASGAKNIIVINLPDIGATPFGQSTDPATFTAISSAYNAGLSYGLGQLGTGIIPINAYGLLNEILASPTIYGFTNTTSTACTTSSSIYCTSAIPSTLVNSTAANDYVFADSVHPTTGADKLVAQYIESVIEAPEKIGMLAEVPLQIMGTQMRAVEGRFLADDNQQATGKFQVFGAYDYNENKFDASSNNPGTDGIGNTVTIGGDMKVTNALSLGMVFGYGQTKTDFNANSGSFKLNAGSISAYTVYRQQNFYVRGMATIGSLDYLDIQRNIPLGPAIRTESGDTSGTLEALGVTGGYLIPLGSLTHGPVASLTYQDVDVVGYSESGDSSTAMTFGAQDRRSMIGSLGYQVFGRMQVASTTLLPFARITYEHEFNADDRTVSAGLVTMNGTFSMPTFKPDENTWRAEAGVAMKVCSNASVFLNYSGTIDQANEKVNAVAIGLKGAF